MMLDKGVDVSCGPSHASETLSAHLLDMHFKNYKINL